MKTYEIINKIKESKLLQDSFWALFGSALGKVLSLLAGIAIARFLGKEIYGEYGTIRTTLTYIAIVSTFGFGYTATKFVVEYIQKHPEKIRKLIRTILNITVVFSSVLAFFQIIFASSISEFMDAPHLKKTLQIFSGLIIINAYVTTQIAILSGVKLFKQNAKINAISGLVCFIFSVILTYFWKLQGALIALVLSYVVQLIMNAIVIHRYVSQYSANNSIEKPEIITMLKFSLPIALQESLYTIVHWLNLLLLIRFSNYGEVGLSSAANIWQSVVIFIPAMLKNVMFSYLTSSNSHSLLVKKFLLFTFISSIIPVIIVLSLSEFISTFYGDSFVGLPKVLKVCVLSSIFIALAEVYCYEFISIGRQWIVFFSRLLRDTLIIITTYITLPNVNSEQAFLAAVISLIFNIIFLVGLIVAYNTKLFIREE